MKANWEYTFKVQAITGTTPASTTYSVEVKQSGVSLGVLYIQSTASPTSSEEVTLVFDTGLSTLNPDESFLIQIAPA